ncbi:MAG: hypothetical protein QOD65_2695, partial [Gaiellales bacterium]|nr:hypothetical protein [Gaiellales bacterium]
MPPVRLSAAGGLAVLVEDDAVRVEFGTSDWFGPARFTIAGQGHPLAVSEQPDNAFVLVDDGRVRVSARASNDSNLLVFRMEALTTIGGLTTGAFSQPSYAWPAFDPSGRADGGVPAGSRGFGFQYTEFAWPTQSDESLARWRLLPFRPSIVEPLGVVAPDGRCLLLGPINA